MRRGTRESRCPIPRCRFRTRKMRVHVFVSHLHPLFLREVPCAPEITRARKAVLDRLLGHPSTYALEGDLHPALLLRWRVQAYLVGHLDPNSRREYLALLPGLRVNGWPLRSFTMNPGPSPQLRRALEDTTGAGLPGGSP